MDHPQDIFYNPRKTLSHGAYLNFVLSRRGAGKTYSTLKYCCKQYLKNGREFIYCRRNDKILKEVVPTLFRELNASGSYKGTFQIKGGLILYKKSDESASEIAGAVVALSLATHYKSANFFKTHYFIYDEFIDEAMRYLPDEPEKLVGLLETIFRMRSFQAWCLANTISWHNPYFRFFNIPTTPVKEWQQKGIRVEEFEAAEYAKIKRETPLAKMIEGTEYGSFILDNKHIADDYTGILKRKPATCPRFAFEWQSELYTLSAIGDKEAYVSRGQMNKTLRVLNLDKLYRVGKWNALGQMPPLVIMKRYAKWGGIFFDSMQSKIAVRDILYKG